MGSEWRKERFGDIVEFISTKQPDPRLSTPGMQMEDFHGAKY